MNKFLIFFKRGQDLQSRVDGIKEQAQACQAATAKSFMIRAVDLLVVGDPDAKYWSGAATIECVTVVQDAVADRDVMPAPASVGGMVRSLP